MKAPAASIRNLLVAVLVLSSDFYLIHDCLADDYTPYFGWPEEFRYGFLGSLLMTNVVVIGGAVILSRGGDRRPFLAGFVLSGAVAIAAVLWLTLQIPWDWSRALSGFLNEKSWPIHLKYWPALPFKRTAFAIRMVAYTGVFTTLELLIATAGGLAARSYSRARSDAYAASADHTDRTCLRAP